MPSFTPATSAVWLLTSPKTASFFVQRMRSPRRSSKVSGAVDLDPSGSPGELSRVPVDQRAVLSDEIHRPGTAVDVVDRQFVALLDTEPLVGAVEPHDTAGGVVIRQGFLGAGVAAGHESCRFQRRSFDLSFANQPLTHNGVYLVAKRVTGGDQPGVFALLGREPQPARGGRPGQVARLDLGHVRPQFLERFLDVPAQAGLDRGFELGLALAHDLVHRRGFHSRLLQLHEGFAGVHRVQLLAVADEHHPGQPQFARDAKGIPGLYGGGERALVHHQHGLFERRAHVAFALRRQASRGHPGVAGEEALQRFALDELGYAHGDGRYPKVMKKLARTDVIILDDWGLTKLTAPQRRELLDILHRHALTFGGPRSRMRFQ